MSSEWVAEAGILLTLTMPLAAWMISVHAKLAVIAVRLQDLCESLRREQANVEQLDARLDRQERRLHTLELRNPVA